MWGSEHMPLKVFVKKVKEAGYDGIEIQIPFDKKYTDELTVLLSDYDLLLAGQQYIQPAAESVESYIDKMTKYLYHLSSFNPLFINSHTGKDYFSFEDNCRAIDKAEKIAVETGIEIFHETHRGRFNFSTAVTKPYLDKYPDLKITADFSHWCCVGESMLDDQEEFVEPAIRRAHYIHARVGYYESPQVNHPAAPENKYALDAHVNWWKRIIKNAKDSGKKMFPVSPEFGPAPYLSAIPFTNKPVSDQWEMNLFMKGVIEKELKPLCE